MFKLIYDKTLDNTIFTKLNLKPVVEDYYKIKNLSFCVADGVTRDNIKGEAVPYPKNKEEALYWVETYPNPSGAFDSAKIVCDTFISEIEKYQEDEISENVIMDIAKKCNKALKPLNANRDIDYVKEDYYCCEAVGGKIIGNYLYCFSLGDCHITLLDKDYNIVFTTINNHRQFEDYINNVYSKEHKFNWNDPKDRILTRRDYRNNPSKKYNGKDVSYGAFSGEDTAEYYIDTYKVNLLNVEYICAYSDGCEPFFENKKNIKNLLEHLDSLKHTGKERTLVVYEKFDK